MTPIRSLVNTGDGILPLSVPVEGLEANYNGEDIPFPSTNSEFVACRWAWIVNDFHSQKIINLLETLIEFLLFLSCPLAWE